MTARRGILVDPTDIEVRREVLSGLPLLNAVLARLGFDQLLGDYLPEPDARCGLEPARAIGVLVRNLALGRAPLYGLGAWAADYDAGLLGLFSGESALLNDDRVGRALDELFFADRASLTTALSLAAVRAYGISLDELHNDSTSICLYGAYRDATGERRGGVSPPRPARGHSKDHRPDLKQLVWILTVSADGAVPITHQMADGNTEDSTTHVATWDELVALLGRADFLYVADCKLATRDNMDHIANHGGRFLTVLPRTRKEDGSGRAWLAAGPIDWAEIARRPAKHKSDPPEVWWAVPAPTCSEEGHRIVWMRSSTKRAHDAAARADRIERSAAALGELATSLTSARCRLRSRVAVEDAATAAVDKAGGARWLRFKVSEEIATDYRQERRGRPGPNTRYRRIDRSRFTLSYSTDAVQVATDAASDGCFPFVTNDKAMTPAELLGAYKAQPHLERRHATFKGVIEAVPVELKSDRRIDALGFCLYAALLTHALIERELRRAMAAAGITDLPLYYED
ncbi:MAG: IS1634 family transposase, partial [Acidimicrobiales bacterium]